MATRRSFIIPAHIRRVHMMRPTHPMHPSAMGTALARRTFQTQRARAICERQLSARLRSLGAGTPPSARDVAAYVALITRTADVVARGGITGVEACLAGLVTGPRWLDATAYALISAATECLHDAIQQQINTQPSPTLAALDPRYRYVPTLVALDPRYRNVWERWI